MKNRLKSYSFWVAIASAVLIFINTLGAKIDLQYMDKIVDAFLTIFVVAGFLDKPKNNSVITDTLTLNKN